MRKSAGPINSSIAMTATSSICTRLPQVGNSVASTDASPSVMPACEMRPVHTYSPVRRSMPDALSPAATPRRIRAMPRRDERQRHEPDLSQRIELQRHPRRDEEHDQHRQRAALDRHLQRIALRDGDVLDHQPGGHRGQQRLEPLGPADLAEQHAHTEQHQRDLASPRTQIQREQRADQTAKRHRAADLPRQPDEHVHVGVGTLAKSQRANCIATENSTSTTRSARTTIASTRSLRRPRAPVSEITAAVIVGEKLMTTMTNSATIASLAMPAASGATGSHGHD